MDYLALAIGLLLLIKGADVLVNSAVKIAGLLKIPTFVVGLFIIAMGTSAPEAAIGIISGIQQTNQITLGNVVGSSIVNIILILGITAMVFSLEVDSKLTKREIITSLLVQGTLTLMLFTGYILSRVEAGILLSGMVLFVGYAYVASKKTADKEPDATEFEEEVFQYVDQQEEVLYEEIPEADAMTEKTSLNKGPGESGKPDSMIKLATLLILGLAGLIGGGNLVVQNAISVAHDLGLSETFIGLTVVALGTTLPELVTCLTAVFKKEEAMAVGNAIGSNLFNILFVLGASGMLHPIAISSDFFLDAFVMMGATVLLLVTVLIFGNISRKLGFIYFASYVFYMVVKINGIV